MILIEPKSKDKRILYQAGKLRLGGMVPVTRAVPPFFLMRGL